MKIRVTIWAVPIREQLDFVGTARKFFEIDVLAQGQIAR
jgi:hypothetical protein